MINNVLIWRCLILNSSITCVGVEFWGLWPQRQLLKIIAGKRKCCEYGIELPNLQRVSLLHSEPRGPSHAARPLNTSVLFSAFLPVFCWTAACELEYRSGPSADTRRSWQSCSRSNARSQKPRVKRTLISCCSFVQVKVRATLQVETFWGSFCF